MSEILYSKEEYLVLDLNNQERSEIKYEISKFPDGQRSIEILGPLPSSIVAIKSRCLWSDLELIVAANSFMKNDYSLATVLFITYLGGGRSDRQFNENQVNYLRDVIAPVINSCEFSHVSIYDPHSDVSEAVIKKATPITNYDLVKEATESASGIKCLIVPDQGAYKKSHTIEDLFDKVVCCTKTRNLSTGEVTVTVPINDIDHTDYCFVVDDICDGGQTFLRIGEQLGFLKIQPELIVSHGIFSKGTNDLLLYYGKIYTTNSYQTLSKRHNVITYNI